MQSALDASTIVIPKSADAGDDHFDILGGYLLSAEDKLCFRETSLRQASQVQDYFE
jgi:hypothetical protein